ncbi:MAG: alpha/beta hydrolase-fold protein [Polyangiales bacterium]
MNLTRRDALRAIAATSLAACRRSTTTSTTTTTMTTVKARGDLTVLDWSFPDQDGVPRRCVVLVPNAATHAQPMPLLIALHGMGETRDARTGAYAWLESYGIDATIEALNAPVFPRAALGDFADDDYAKLLTGELAAQPYRGLVVACPFVDRGLNIHYNDWLADTLVPRLRRETPVLASAASTGIDGVSFGGLAALGAGLARPDVFGVVGALQPALGQDDYVAALSDSIPAQLKGRRLRLVTSTDDMFRARIEALHASLDRASIAHDFRVTPGPHDYAWNRGAGAVEMLAWHDRVQART